MQSLIEAAEREVLLCKDATVSNMTDHVTYSTVDTDLNAERIMRRHDIQGRPLLTPGDGNCLFNAVSIILTGTTELATELRYKTCLQMATRKERVLEGHPNIDDLFIVSPDYDHSLLACARMCEFSSPWTILGLSQVLQRNVVSLYPPENGSGDETVQILTTVFGSFQHDLPLSIMWTGPKKRKGKMWLPNHFLPIAPLSSDDDCDDERQTEEGACGGCDDDDDDDDVLKNDDYVHEERVEVDHSANDDEQASNSSIVLHDDDDDDKTDDDNETDDDILDNDDVTGLCTDGKALPNDNFFPVNEVLDLLTGGTLEKIHASVPLGRKENVWFLVDNSDNATRRKTGHKCQYWDDCGAWGNGTKASTPSTLYTRQNGHVIHVVKRNGKYCQEKQSNGKKVYKAVEPQPVSENVFTLRRNYAKHAHSNDYVRRVTWLEEDQKRCLYEYRGKYPGAHAHGKSANPERTGAYVRLQPQVMEKLKEDVKTQKPDKLYREADVLYGPKKKRVIYDAKHRAKREGMDMPTARTGTFADQVRTVEGMAHTEKYKDFIQVITRAQGKVPTIILHSKEQIDDMKRCCSPGPNGVRSVMTFDKTFNLADLHVTTAVYKNVAVVNSRTMEHPGFFGPFFLHGNSDFRVFAQFFQHIALELSDSPSPVLGSDEEKAMRNAMAFAFPDAGMLTCSRHLRGNCVNYLTDKIGLPHGPKMRLLSTIFGENGLVHSTSEVVFETRLDVAYREMQKIAPGFIPYFESHVLDKIKDNLAASQLPHLADVSGSWTSNLAESLNHVLKQTTNWRNLNLPLLVEALHDLVDGQSKEIERSLIGRGDLMLHEQFLKFKMTPDAWQALPERRRKKHICRFTKKVREANMQMSRGCEGGDLENAPKDRGRKPGQKSRKTAKTRTPKKT